MSDPDSYFPPIGDYVLSKPCPKCSAPPWTPCHAPHKIATYRRRDDLNARLGQPSLPPPRVTDVSHSQRYKAGIAHHLRDIGKAPWPEDREPGKCYGTIPPRPAELPAQG